MEHRSMSYPQVQHAYPFQSAPQTQISNQQHQQVPPLLDEAAVTALILEIAIPERREQALLILGKCRDTIPNLAVLLWHSFGTMTIFLGEILSIYPHLTNEKLSPAASKRVCHVLGLLQCVASHPETRHLLLAAHFPQYFYPFLLSSIRTDPFEYLRLTSLGVIGTLVKIEDPEVVKYLLQTEIIPMCLKNMDSPFEKTKIVATFIVQRILHEDFGLTYVCATYERFSQVALILTKMITSLDKDKLSFQLLKHIVLCFRRLADNPKAQESLRKCLPEQLRDGSFDGLAQSDSSFAAILGQLQQMTDPKASVTATAGTAAASQPVSQQGLQMPMMHQQLPRA